MLKYSTLFNTMHSLLDRAKNSYKNSRKQFLSFRMLGEALFFSIPMCFSFFFFKETFLPWSECTMNVPTNNSEALQRTAYYLCYYFGFTLASHYQYIAIISAGFSICRFSTSDIFFSQEQQLNRTQKIYTNM